ncbi:MAG: aminopeptidase [bacterium]|jgi:aminopeptidase
MSDLRVERLADLLINYSLKVKKNDLVVIAGSVIAEPLIKEAMKAVMARGAHPTTRLAFEWQDELFFQMAADHQLSFTNPFVLHQMEKMDKFLGVWAGENSKKLTTVDPAKIAKVSQARRPISDIFSERDASGSLQWVGTIYPAAGEAQDAEMGTEEWADFCYSACLCDKPNPAKRWKEVRDHQKEMVKFLEKAKIFRIQAEGTDLTLDCTGRRWINCCGEKNMPDGEVFTAPIETATTGKIRYTVPTVYGGREVNDIELTFKAGKVVKNKAAKGGEILSAMIEQDAGAKILGEFAIGTNFGIKNYTKNILFDEKIGGTVHLALGRCYKECGGTNESALHWDMICDLRQGGTLTADGKKILVDGKILI